MPPDDDLAHDTNLYSVKPTKKKYIQYSITCIYKYKYKYADMYVYKHTCIWIMYYIY